MEENACCAPDGRGPLALLRSHGPNVTHTANDSDNTPAAAKATAPVTQSVADAGAGVGGDPIVGCYQWFNNVSVVIRADHTDDGRRVDGELRRW